MKTKIYIVASTNIESTKAFTNKLFAQDYRDELQESERRDKVTITEQEIDVPYATDRRKYGMTLQEVADQIRDFTGDTRGEAKRKAKIFAHHISLRHVSDIRNLRYGHRTDEHGNRTEDHDWLEIEWRDLDGDRDTFSIIE